MKTNIIFLAIIILVVGGCKTVKQTKTTSQTSKAQNITVKESSETHNDIKLKVDSSKLTIDKGNVSESINEEIVTVVYAPVDSTGKQAIISVTTTKRGIARNENKNLHENKQNTSQLRDKSDSKSGARMVASSENKTKEKVESKEESKTPGWVYYISSLCLVVFFVFVFFKVTK